MPTPTRGRDLKIVTTSILHDADGKLVEVNNEMDAAVLRWQSREELPIELII